MESRVLEEWIGRQEEARDEVTAPAVRRLAALLDLPPDDWRRGRAMPGPWYVVLFGPETRQSALGPDGHPAKGAVPPAGPAAAADVRRAARVVSRAALHRRRSDPRIAHPEHHAEAGTLRRDVLRHRAARDRGAARGRGRRGAGSRLSRGVAGGDGEARGIARSGQPRVDAHAHAGPDHGVPLLGDHVQRPPDPLRRGVHPREGGLSRSRRQRRAHDAAALGIRDVADRDGDQVVRVPERARRCS